LEYVVVAPTLNPQRRLPAERWASIIPAEHDVQIYQHDDSLLETLEAYVSDGLRAGEGVIVIATAAHAAALEARLRAAGLDVARASAEGRYRLLDAEATLARFMEQDWPDDERFFQTMSALLAEARGPGRRVRAFGEMVAVLWGQGQRSATVRLEYLWNKLQERHALRLLCAYPVSGFTHDAVASLFEICAQHARAIPG
jgi:hypothetical protein